MLGMLRIVSLMKAHVSLNELIHSLQNHCFLQKKIDLKKQPKTLFFRTNWNDTDASEWLLMATDFRKTCQSNDRKVIDVFPNYEYQSLSASSTKCVNRHVSYKYISIRLGASIGVYIHMKIWSTVDSWYQTIKSSWVFLVESQTDFRVLHFVGVFIPIAEFRLVDGTRAKNSFS